MSEEDPATETDPCRQRRFWERLYGALTLDPNVYEEVEHDTEAMAQAAGVVALAAVARGLGFGDIPYSLVAGFVGWVVAAAAVWIIGVKILEHSSDYPELLRTLGFATAPRVLLVLGVLPIGPLRPLLWLFVTFLLVVAFVVAVRQALDVRTDRAVFVCLVAASLNVLPTLLLGKMAWL
jgi:hypothetical protein